MTWLSWIISNIVLASLLALLAVFVQRRLRLPGVARVLWVLVLVKLVTPPFVNVPLLELPGTMACAMGICKCAHEGMQYAAISTALWGLLVAWAAGAATTSWNAWRRWSYFQRLAAHAEPAPLEWQTTAARLSSELLIRNAPEILAAPGRLPPLVVPGWPHSRMLLPSELLDQLNEPQREALLLHELVHIKRGDHLVRLLELAVRVVYWWLPGVGSIGRQLRACEETCCDATVVAHLPQARRDYARLLLDVVDFASPLAPQAVPQGTAMSAADDLEGRMRGILEASPAKRRAWPAGALTLGLACAVIPCQLHYNFVAPGVAASESSAPGAKARCEPVPTNKANSMPLDDRCAPYTSFVCPS